MKVIVRVPNCRRTQREYDWRGTRVKKLEQLRRDFLFMPSVVKSKTGNASLRRPIGLRRREEFREECEYQRGGVLSFKNRIPVIRNAQFFTEDIKRLRAITPFH